MGTYVAGSFALMAAASPRIRDRVAFVVAYAPYSSMWTLTQDIVTSTRSWGTGREPWPVDPLTRTVYVRSLTAVLDPHEADPLRRAALGEGEQGDLDPQQLSEEGRAVYPLLGRLGGTPRHDCLDTCLQWSVRRFPSVAGRSRRPSTRADGLIGMLGGRVSSHRP